MWCSTNCSRTSRSVTPPSWPPTMRKPPAPPTVYPPSHDRSNRRMMMSNRAKRMLQHQLRHSAEGQLNLIPMIDILTVMVSFLLVYSTNVEVVQNSKAIEIPQSISEQQPRVTVVVMLTKDELFVQGEPITTVKEIQAADGN